MKKRVGNNGADKTDKDKISSNNSGDSNNEEESFVHTEETRQ